MDIPFNKPLFLGDEVKYVEDAIHSSKASISANGKYTKLCESFLSDHFSTSVLLTHSCTSALEIIALLLKDDSSRDEIIMPSYTFVSTANAFLKFGFKIRFVDIEPYTMNMDASCVEQAVSPQTRAVVAVNYGGCAPDLESLARICKSQNVELIEDAAQSLGSTYKGRPLGSFGSLATLSFHETKNVTAGEGGALIINDKSYLQKAHFIREKGTNRIDFTNGTVDKYTWVTIGGHYMMGDLNAAYLYSGLQQLQKITEKRKSIWNTLHKELEDLEKKKLITRQVIPEYFSHNAHMFFFKVEDLTARKLLLAQLNSQGVNATFHYVPLHSSPVGQQQTTFFGQDKFTSQESEKLIRLPLYFGLENQEIDHIINTVRNFFSSSSAKSSAS